MEAEGEVMRRRADRMADLYSLEVVERLAGQSERAGLGRDCCVVCGGAASQRCSRCRKQRYCSKQCQLQHWPNHKPVCSKQ